MTKHKKILAMIRKWERSDIAKSTFAREHGIAIPTFYYWCRRYQQSATTTSVPSFIELPLPADSSPRGVEASSGAPRLRLEFADGLSISIY